MLCSVLAVLVWFRSISVSETCFVSIIAAQFPSTRSVQCNMCMEYYWQHQKNLLIPLFYSDEIIELFWEYQEIPVPTWKQNVLNWIEVVSGIVLEILTQSWCSSWVSVEILCNWSAWTHCSSYWKANVKGKNAAHVWNGWDTRATVGFILQALT